jgi:hypothetical protein
MEEVIWKLMEGVIWRLMGEVSWFRFVMKVIIIINFRFRFKIVAKY